MDLLSVCKLNAHLSKPAGVWLPDLMGSFEFQGIF